MAPTPDSNDDLSKGEIQPHKPKVALDRKGKPADKNPKAVQLKSLYNQAVKATRQEVANYWINYAFLEGAQWVYWDDQNQRMMDMPRDPTRSRITINRMAANTRTIISKAMQRHMTFEVERNAADDASVRGARLGETILHNIAAGHDWEVKRESLLQATWKGGTGAVSVDWDPKARDVLIPATDDGQAPVHEGDSVETVLSIAEFVVEAGSRDGERARYWFKALTAPPLAVQAQYGLEWVPDADGFIAQQPYSGRFTASHPAELESTLVLTYYERPNALNEKGSIVVIVNDQIVHEAAWPFPWKDRLNLHIARETVVENRWTGDTIVTYARPIQTALNATETNIMEHMKKAGNARLAVPQSSMDLIENLTDQAAELIPYNDGLSTTPSWIAPPAMPDWWNNRPDALTIMLDDIMGVHDVSRGDAPPNIESGYGISILVEQDTTPVGRLVKETARVWGEVASDVLALYEQEVTTKRTVAVAAPGQPAIQTQWSGKDLHGQTKAIVPEDSILPRSRAAQMQNAQKMLEMGMIQPGDIATYAFLTEMPDARFVLEAVSPDIAWARQENAMFGAGRMSTVEPWEDDEAHINEHNRYRKTMDFRLLPPEQQEAIATHIKAHESQAAAKLGQRQAGAQISPMLAMAPRADGAPVVDPALAAPPQPSETAVAQGADPTFAALDQVGGVTDEIIAALEQEAPEEPLPAE